MAVKETVMESAFSFRLWRRRFSINPHAFPITGSEGVYNGVFFSFTIWRSLILVKLQAFAINGSEGFYDGVSEGVWF